MQQDFINNMKALVLDSEGKAWMFRNGQDQLEVAENISNSILKKYSGNTVASTKYNREGAYAKLDPREKAIVDMIIMDNMHGS